MIPESPLTLLDRITPIQCRLIARRMDSRGKPITLLEIAASANMSIQKAAWISGQTTWALITVGEASRFMSACGVNLRNIRRHMEYIRCTSRCGWPLAHLAGLKKSTRNSLLKLL